MPQLSAEQQDAIDEAIDRQLFRINKIVGRTFGQEFSEQEIADQFSKINQPVMEQVRQQEQSARPAPVAKPPPKMVNIGGQMVPEYSVEGGFVNDASGEATAKIRQGLR